MPRSREVDLTGWHADLRHAVLDSSNNELRSRAFQLENELHQQCARFSPFTLFRPIIAST